MNKINKQTMQHISVKGENTGSGYTGKSKNRFTVVSIQTTVYSSIIINYCIIYLYYNCKITFATLYQFGQVTSITTNLQNSINTLNVYLSI